MGSWLFVFVLATPLVACHPTSNICSTRAETLSDGDGGQQRCARAEDCPRQASAFFCTSDGLPEADCVGCDDTVCTRHVAEPCN